MKTTNIRIAIKANTIDFFNDFKRVNLLLLAIFLSLSTFLSNIILVLGATICCLSLCISRNKKNFVIVMKNNRALFALAVLTTYCVGYSCSVAFIFEEPVNVHTLKKTFLLFLIFLFAIDLDKQKTRISLVKAFIFGVFLMVLGAYVKINGLISAEYFYPTYSESFKDSIFSSLLVACALYCSLVFIKHNINKVMFFLLFLLFFHYLYFISTGRTGQILGIFLICFFSINLKLFKQNKILLFTLLVIFVCGLFKYGGSFNRRMTVVSSEIINFYVQNDIVSEEQATSNNVQSSFGSRREFAQNAWHLFLEKPILGWGINNFSKAYNDHFPLRKQSYGQEVDNPHNQYLFILVEVGIVGFILYSWFFYQLLRQFLLVSGIEYELYIGPIIAILLGSLVNSWLNDSTSRTLLICFSSLVTAAHLFEKKGCNE
jgi:O-antigen ligase